MNGAPQLFFSCRAPARSLAHRARARHPAPRRAKNSTGAGRVPVRGEANSFSAGMANLAVRGCASRFFVLAARYFRLADRSTRWAEAGPAIFVFLAVRAFASGGQLGHRAAKTGEGKTQRSVLHVSPSIRPRQGSPRLEPTSRSAWPRHTAKRLALAAARLRESDGTACNQSTLDAIEA